MAWVDVESALLDRVADLAGGATNTGTRLPLGLGERLPFIHARRVGGSDRGWEFTSRVVLTMFAASRGQLWDMADQVAVRLLSQGGFVQAGVECTVVTAESANAEVPNPDPATGYRQVVATYRITAQRP